MLNELKDIVNFILANWYFPPILFIFYFVLRKNDFGRRINCILLYICNFPLIYKLDKVYITACIKAINSGDPLPPMPELVRLIREHARNTEFNKRLTETDFVDKKVVDLKKTEAIKFFKPSSFDCESRDKSVQEDE